MNILNLIGRSKALFSEDLNRYGTKIESMVNGGSFLVIGGAGSIGQAVVKELFARNPQKLHVVDISENNLVELVRDIRSSLGYISGDFRTFAVDFGSAEFESLLRNEGEYDYVLNLSALKHVRSEKDPYTLMRLIQVNIMFTLKLYQRLKELNVKKYFCVSTDKAANPANMMGASKRIMEMFLMRESGQVPFSSARFANVAFSDGSLLHGFNQRILKNQPISAPMDVRRYFVTPKEAGELCLISCLLGEDRNIFFPRLSEELNLVRFNDIAIKYLEARGYTAYRCESEEVARKSVDSLKQKKCWPVYFFESDTTGEKSFEEFYMEGEDVDWQSFKNIGVIKSSLEFDVTKLGDFEKEIGQFLSSGNWEKRDLLGLFNDLIPGFTHKETGKYLDGKM